ncbi:chromate transporter [Thermosipho melanesiensis]|uniref:Chromate transporter n=3 Tax=Thermosipho melanesiensis TaxID=46541 RepID=A6LP95_THEM4|nr:Chromate transporter [Thermosipho melanesiensis BI429]APT74768.1 chromate transporter [Thermosipho melanesiensis]OOC35102.1 chromate transporter [Thermosipho melanesiensis]OOC35138.1 chromate transporter [Thermosipho melanesiensis]OOC36823.1 chromate transporter [Thermosipho melanesiensis]
MKSSYSKVWEIFIKFFVTSALTLGGGYAMVPVFKKKFSKYIDEEKFSTILSLAQSMPGPIAINIAILIGEELLGIWGIISAVFGVLLPPVWVVVLAGTIVGKYSQVLHPFFSGIYGSILGLVLGVVYSMVKLQKWDILKILILVISVILAYFFKNFTIPIFIFLVWWYYVRGYNRDFRRR